MIKALVEKRGQLAKELRDMLDGIKAEARAFSEEEHSKFDSVEREISELDKTIAAEKRAEKLIADTPDNEDTADEKRAEKDSDTELRAARDTVNDFIRGNEVRAGEMSVSSTGSIVPSEFSGDIIRKTVALSGILGMVGKVNSKGEYKQIVADDNQQISAGWTGELEEITSSTAKYSTISIKHHKLTSLAKLSEEVINQTDFNIVADVEMQMMRDFALKSETAVLKGTGTDRPTGLTTSGIVYKLETPDVITASDIVKIYHKLPAAYQNDAAWIMSNDTLCAVRLLSDGAGRYIFHQNENLTTGYAGILLGKPVFVSDAMDNLGAGNHPILFGDFSRAYKANISPEMSMQILNEKFATQGAKGILSTMWIDGKPVNKYAYVNVECPAAENVAADDTTE